MRQGLSEPLAEHDHYRRHELDRSVSRPLQELYTTHANSHPEEVAEYMTAPPRSLRRVALMIGRASGVELPWSLASELPRVFSRTWGAWSRLALARAARAAAG